MLFRPLSSRLVLLGGPRDGGQDLVGEDEGLDPPEDVDEHDEDGDVLHPRPLQHLGRKMVQMFKFTG